jgi:hypothetical protein
MRIDLHCHSRYSHDNYLDPKDVIEEAVTKGLHGVCFTEHFSVTASLPVTKLPAPAGFHIFRGVEISTGEGHLLAYGLIDDAWNRWGRHLHLPLTGVIDAVHRCGGICVPAHPYRGYDSLGDRLYHLSGIDAVETVNGGNPPGADEKARAAAAKRSLPGIGGSDCHVKHRVGVAYTEFTTPVATLAELVREIREGRCRGVSAPAKR